jgi:hypothetical protein
MVAATKKASHNHLRALATSAALAGYYRDMYRQAATMVSPRKVIRLLNEAEVRFVLIGTHGLGGYRSQARATQDVDVLIARRGHAKAIRVLRSAFPKLVMQDSPIVTRFKDPATGEPRIDLMKPLQKVHQMVFRHTQQVGDSHRVPSLEMALISKFAAMTSPYRERLRKMQDAVDFADMVVHNKSEIDRAKLVRLAEQVYAGGSKEVNELIANIFSGRPIQV